MANGAVDIFEISGASSKNIDIVKHIAQKLAEETFPKFYSPISEAEVRLNGGGRLTISSGPKNDVVVNLVYSRSGIHCRESMVYRLKESGPRGDNELYLIRTNFGKTRYKTYGQIIKRSWSKFASEFLSFGGMNRQFCEEVCCTNKAGTVGIFPVDSSVKTSNYTSVSALVLLMRTPQVFVDARRKTSRTYVEAIGKYIEDYLKTKTSGKEPVRGSNYSRPKRPMRYSHNSSDNIVWHLAYLTGEASGYKSTGNYTDPNGPKSYIAKHRASISSKFSKLTDEQMSLIKEAFGSSENLNLWNENISSKFRFTGETA